MLVTESEFMLLDPDKSQVGYGVVKFIAFLQVIFILNVHIRVPSLSLSIFFRMLTYQLIQLIVVLYSLSPIIGANHR